MRRFLPGAISRWRCSSERLSKSLLARSRFAFQVRRAASSNRASVDMLLYLRHSAVDGEFDASDEATVVGGEEESGLGDLDRLAHAAERDLLDHLRLESRDLIGGEAAFAQDGRIDGSGRDDVDADLAGFEVRGPGAG